VEIYQNCNVFNDGAFDEILGKEVRTDMLIPLEHGSPIRFGVDGSTGVVMQSDGRLRIASVDEVGPDAFLVHDEAREPAGLAFQLSRLAAGPHEPTPVGVFRAVQRPTYDELVQDQLLAAQEKQGPGDLAALLASGGTWTV
jgi:2-oxoglutarate ferredoxin oxidoreductase subunit beta